MAVENTVQVWPCACLDNLGVPTPYHPEMRRLTPRQYSWYPEYKPYGWRAVQPPYTLVQNIAFASYILTSHRKIPTGRVLNNLCQFWQLKITPLKAADNCMNVLIPTSCRWHHLWLIPHRFLKIQTVHWLPRNSCPNTRNIFQPRYCCWIWYQSFIDELQVE
jgi:hypothetical protein